MASTHVDTMYNPNAEKIFRAPPGKLTWPVVYAMFLGLAGGCMFGYDIGVTGGVRQQQTVVWVVDRMTCQKLH